jgi:hypothetical protein
MEEVPGNLVKKIPMYDCGIAHLSYKDCCDWVCNVLQIQSKHNASLSSSTVVLKDDDLNERLSFVANVVVGLYSKFPPLPLNKKKNKEYHYQQQQQKPILEINVDVCDLELIVPPCFRQVMIAKRFPRYWERLWLLTTFRAAGVSLETFGAWLEEKNRQYPKENGISTLARFNYEKEWDNSLKAIYCKNVFSRTKKNTENDIVCPFMTKERIRCGGDDIEDLCKRECMPNERYTISGPVNVIKLLQNRLYNNKSNAAAAVGASTMKIESVDLSGLK